MKRVLLFLSLVSSLWAGPTLTLSGTTSPLTITMSGSAAPTGLQFVVQLTGTSLVQMTGTAGAVTIAASKNLICNTQTNSTMTCMIVSQSGTNATIADGVIVTVNYTYTGGGTETFTIPNQSDESMTGSTLNLTLSSYSGLGGTMVKCDVSRDGVINGLDLDIITRWALGTDSVPPGALCDINADGNCDILDVNIVARYLTSGGTCP
jgi:dockerin type I repeat protein